MPDAGAPLPEIGELLSLTIDWPRRYKLMRMHTACHLLSVICPFPITGAAVGEAESRVDFDMSETIDKAEVSRRLMELVEGRSPVFTQWIAEEELDANPGLVKSKNVRPPRGAGRDPAGVHRRGFVRRQPALRRDACRRDGRGRRDPHRKDREEGQGEPALPHPFRPRPGRRLSQPEGHSSMSENRSRFVVEPDWLAANLETRHQDRRRLLVPAGAGARRAEGIRGGPHPGRRLLRPGRGRRSGVEPAPCPALA